MIFGYLASRGTWTLPHLTLGPGVAQYLVRDGGCRFMAAWVKEEEKLSSTGGEEERCGRSGQG